MRWFTNSINEEVAKFRATLVVSRKVFDQVKEKLRKANRPYAEKDVLEELKTYIDFEPEDYLAEPEVEDL